MTDEKTNEMRDERQYTVRMSEDCGGSQTITITIPAGTVEVQDAQAIAEAEEELRDWIRDGDYGHDGASVSARYTLSDDEYEWPGKSVEVDIEPDHDYLIRQAGGDIECEHDWTSEKEGGIDENPGVWSIGGTTMKFSSHCRVCGLHRIEISTGSQRNPGDHDTVEYEQPDSWCSECQSGDCRCEADNA